MIKEQEGIFSCILSPFFFSFLPRCANFSDLDICRYFTYLVKRGLWLWGSCIQQSPLVVVWAYPPGPGRLAPGPWRRPHAQQTWGKRGSQRQPAGGPCVVAGLIVLHSGWTVRSSWGAVGRLAPRQVSQERRECSGPTQWCWTGVGQPIHKYCRCPWRSRGLQATVDHTELHSGCWGRVQLSGVAR